LEIRDRIALVTGTSSGIGAALTNALLQRNWAVLGLSRRKASFDSPHYRHIEIDLADQSALSTLAEGELRPMFGDSCWERIGLVNNAAHLGALRPVEKMALSELGAVFSVNSVAPIFLMGLMVGVAPSESSLRIVNVSSGAAGRGIPGLADYCASKAALRIAGEALGAELDASASEERRDAEILSYEPGIVDTSMQEKARGSTPEEFPSHEVFRGFAERGELHEPNAVVGNIVEFLSGKTGAPFTELRYDGAGGSRS
jgi:benzil reductase ((S)-benzoin forming)